MVLSSITIYAAIVLLTLLYIYVKHQYSYWRKRNIPYDEPVFLIGNFYARRQRGLFNLFKDIYSKYKGSIPFVGYFLLTTPSVVLMDLDLVRDVLIKDFNNFDERGNYCNEKGDPISAHLASLAGTRWKTLRGKLTPTFTSGKIKGMFSLMSKIGETLVQVVAEEIKTEPNVDTKELLSRLSTDIIGSCAFGIDCNSLKDPDVPFRQFGKKLFGLDDTRLSLFFVEAFPKLGRLLNMRRFPEEISNFYTKMVNETVDYRKKNKVTRNDFMDLLINLGNQKVDDEKNGNTVSAGLTMNEIIAQSVIFFGAGFETSSATMNFALYELARNQEIQEKLRNEVTVVLAKHGNQITYEGIKEMVYLKKVISETLRMYTPIPVLRRIAREDYPTNNPKFVIPKGAQVAIPAHNIHYDPDIYPNPSVFDPERFAPEEVNKRHPMSWLAFGDGPRNCIGMRFGKLQTSLGLALLVKNFRFLVTDDTPIPMKFDSHARLLAPEKKIILRVEKLNKE